MYGNITSMRTCAPVRRAKENPHVAATASMYPLISSVTRVVGNPTEPPHFRANTS